MAAIGTVPLFAPFALSLASAPDTNNFVVDASNDGLEFCFQAPSTGPVLTRCAIRCGALTGSSPTYVLSLQGVGTDGFADGTIKGGGSPVSVEITPESGDAGKVKTYTFANSYDSTAGEALALVLSPKSGTSIDGSNNWSFTRYDNGYFEYGTWQAITVTAGSKARATRNPFMLIGSADTWYARGWVHESNNYVIPGASPVYAGCKFTLPAGIGDTVSCVGWWAYATNTAAGKTLRATLLDGSDNVLDYIDHDTDACVPMGRGYFDTAAISLTCGSTYRLVLSTSDSAGARLRYETLPDATMWNTQPWGGCSQLTYGDTGSWTDNNLAWPFIGPIISDITEPTASGGGGPVIGSRIVRGLGAL